MELGKWVLQISGPGEIEQERFDSKEQLMGHLEEMSEASKYSSIVIMVTPGGTEEIVSTPARQKQRPRDPSKTGVGPK